MRPHRSGNYAVRGTILSNSGFLASLKGASPELEAIKRTQAVIEFDVSGNILDAYKLFLDAMGYSNDEIRGRHHSIFLEAGERESASYKSVRRQNIWRNSRRRLAECRPRLGVDIMRRACGAASADVRWSVA